MQLGELLKVFCKKFFPKTITFINVSSKVYWRTVFLLKSEHLNLKNHHGSNSLLSYVIFSYKLYSHTLYQFYIVPLYFNHKRIISSCSHFHYFKLIWFRNKIIFGYLFITNVLWCYWNCIKPPGVELQNWKEKEGIFRLHSLHHSHS